MEAWEIVLAGVLVLGLLVLLVLAPFVAFRIGRALGSRFDRGDR